MSPVQNYAASFCGIPMPIFSKKGHISEFSKKWAYCKWAYFEKLQKNGHIANGNIFKYAHLKLLNMNQNQISTNRKYERICDCYIRNP